MIFDNQKKKYFHICTKQNRSQQVQLYLMEDQTFLQALRSILMKFHEAFEDGQYTDSYLNQIAGMLAKQQEITSSFFENFYDYVTSDPEIDKIVSLFEDFHVNHIIVKNRKFYLMSHWLYYHACKFKGSLNLNGSGKKVMDIIMKKQNLSQTFQKVVQSLGLAKAEAKQFYSDIQNHSIFKQLQGILNKQSSSINLNKEKRDEKHKQLIEILDKMRQFSAPKVVEYELQKHILVIFQQAYYNTLSQYGQKVVRELMPIEEFFELLKAKKRNSMNIKKKVDQFKQVSDKKVKYTILQGMKAELILLDTFSLSRLIKLSEDSICFDDGNKTNKNIILLVGPSGSGKSTIILRALGYKLVRTQIQGLPTLQPQNLRPEHAALRTSPQSTSTTRYMFSTKIPKSVLPDGTDKQLYLCDSPGFNDTAGAEVDISNSISIYQTLRTCQSVKLVVVISQRIVGDKFDGIRQIAKMVSNFVVKYSSIKKQVSIILNKFESDTELQRLSPGIKSILDNLKSNQAKDEQYKSFLNSLQQKLKKKDYIRFHPEDTDIKYDLIGQLLEGSITNTKATFKQSLSSKSSNMIKIRKSLLQKYIQQQMEADKKAALYYLKQLQLLSKCLNNNFTYQQYTQAKQLIEGKINQQFCLVQKKIRAQILENATNANTYSEIQAIKEQIQSYSIFNSVIRRMQQQNHFKNILAQIQDQLKQKMVKLNDQSCYIENSIQLTMKEWTKIASYFSYFKQMQLQSIYEGLFKNFESKKTKTLQMLQERKLEDVQHSLILLNNMLEVIQKVKETVVKIYSEKITDFQDKNLEDIKLKIVETFQLMVKESTQCFEYRQNSLQAVSHDHINKAKETIATFDQLEEKGIKTKSYKKRIIEIISNHFLKIIEQSNKILQPSNKNNSSSALNKRIKVYKQNTLKIKQIPGIYDIIGKKIQKLWQEFDRYIIQQKQRLKIFLQDLKKMQSINKSSLKSLKSRINRVLKFSQGDDQLTISVNRLKLDIKRSLSEHIRCLRKRVDGINLTLMRHQSLQRQKVRGAIQTFYQVQAFFDTKQFGQKDYLTATGLENGQYDDYDFSSEDDFKQNQADISQDIKRMFSDIIYKLLTPVREITDQSKKHRSRGLNKLSLSYFTFVQHFLSYDQQIINGDLATNKHFIQKIQEIQKQGKYFSYLKEHLQNVIGQFDSIYDGFKKADPQNNFEPITISMIKQLQKFTNFIQKVQSAENLQYLLLNHFQSRQYLQRIFYILSSFSQLVNRISSNRKQNHIDYVKKISILKQLVEEMKYFDDVKLCFETTKYFNFGKIHQKLSKQILIIEGRQEKCIENLFIDQNIDVGAIKKMYEYLSQDDIKNQEKLMKIESDLREYGDKTKKQIQKLREDFINEAENLQSSSAVTYVNKLQKAFRVFEEVGEFLLHKNKFMEYFSLNEGFFKSELQQLKQKMLDTYQSVKNKLSHFQFKKKAKANIFYQMLATLKKVEYIAGKMDIQQYRQLYEYVNKRQENQTKGTQINGLKLSERLKSYESQYNNRFRKNFIESSGNLSQIQQYISEPSFISLYSRISQDEKILVDSKIEQLMTQRLQSFKESFYKSDEQRKRRQEAIKIQKLPPNLKTLYKQQIKQIKATFQQKEESEIKDLRSELNGSDIHAYVIRFQQCSSPNVQKECKNIIQKKIKSIGKEIINIGEGKKICAIFKNYLKYFGYQNNGEMLRKVQSSDQLKSIFITEKKTIFANFIGEVRQFLRSVESQITKCSGQHLQTFPSQCQQISELYMLTIGEDYKEVPQQQFEQLLKILKDFIKKITEKISNCISQQKPINSNHSLVEIQKDLIQLRLYRAFADCFIKQSKIQGNNQSEHYEFLKETCKKLKQFNVDGVRQANLKNEIDSMVENLRSIQFYNDIILGSSQLNEFEFEKNKYNAWRKVKDYESFYNKYLAKQEQDKISSKKLSQHMQQKWENNISLVEQQLSLAASRVEQEISPRIMLLYNFSCILYKRKWGFIDKSLTSKQLLEQIIQKFLKKNRETLDAQLLDIEQIIEQKKNIQQSYKKDKQAAQDQYQKIRRNAQQLKQELFDRIKSMSDENVKEKQNLEIQNIEEKKNSQIQSIRSNNYNRYLKKVKQNQQRLHDLIKKDVIKQIIISKKFLQSIVWKTREKNYQFIDYLSRLNKKLKLINSIIYKELSESSNIYALMLASDSAIFQSQAAIQFKNKTSKQDIDYVLEKCRQINDNPSFKQEIQKKYDIYIKEYNRIINDFHQNPDSQQIDMVAKLLKDQKERNRQNHNDNIHSSVTIARIFATWSMMKADTSNEQKKSVDFQPHPAQIVAIFLLTDFDQGPIINSLAEVLTGEGKSIVLAGLCCYLALKGYYPYCACYSQYLSSRDEEQFKALFERLQVRQIVRYGTFNDHCKRIVNDISTKSGKSKQFKDHIQLIMLNEQQSRVSLESITSISKFFCDDRQIEKQRKILIIDEVDIFFSQNFFGRLYCPTLSLEGQQVKKLFQFIWRETMQSRLNDSVKKINKQEIYKSQEFKILIEKYPTLQSLLQNQVIGMLQAVYNFSHSYTLHQQSIKYKDNDTITDQISYGYKTVFANCYQFERNTISSISYNNSFKISLNIAPLSYSELPNYFHGILGVSGTIDSMSRERKDLLQKKYTVKNMYNIPSIYGENRRQKDRFEITKDEDFYLTIVNHVKAVSQAKRPVVIFFKTIKDICNFYKSPSFSELTKHTSILSEETNYQLRDLIIKRVGQRQKITIMTQSFSRGTDFKIFDKNINQSGGLHIILTYIPADHSEYVQVKGRTARQGNKGSFQILINTTERQKIYNSSSGQDQCNLQKLMLDFWGKNQAAYCQQLQKSAEAACKKHDNTVKFFRGKLNRQDIIKFVQCQNSFSAAKPKHVRTLIGVDGTSSMGKALQRVTSILESSFERTNQIIRNKNVSGSFQNQIAIYRNYNSQAQALFENSGFETQCQKLKQFLTSRKIEGGFGSEAMEVLFFHANKIQNLGQIILIADARANNFKETIFKRKTRGQSYWIAQGVPVLNESEQVQKLRIKNVKIHTLYIELQSQGQKTKRQLRQYCNIVSSLTKGTSEKFDIDSEQAPDFLTRFLVTNILQLIGGEERGQELIQSYDENFGPLRL